MGQDASFHRELVRPFREERKTTELCNSARRPFKTETKIKKHPGRLWRTHLRPGQSSHLTCNTRHPCKDGVGGVKCTSSLSVPSDLLESQIQVLVFIPVKLLHFNLHWS